MHGWKSRLNRIELTKGDQMSDQKGFTILELLVTVTIVLVLVALIYSAVEGARGKASMVSCVNNLRQIGIANQMHMQEFQRVMAGETPYSRWRRTIRDYLAPDDPNRYQKILKVMICPADPQHGLPKNGQATAINTLSYAVNYAVRETGEAGKRVFDPKINPHSKVVYAGDFSVHHPGLTNWIPGHSESVLRERFDIHRHNGRANFVFLDGHVESFKIESLFPSGENNSILREQPF